jgi:hypothetical protein
MKRFILLVLFGVLCLTVHSQTGKVYVVLFMHNEDNTFGDIEDPLVRNDYLRHRTALIDMSEYLHEKGVQFAWQSDWKFLELVLKYETPELMAETGGKNIVRWMKEDMGITVDAHSHEHYGYNYADVACLLDSLGVATTRIIGGHVWDPYDDSYANWERFRNPLRGTTYTHYVWNANVLIGSGTPNHASDPAPSGIWHPKDKYHYWEDDPDGEILCVGQYKGDLEGVQELIDLRKSGTLPNSDILTCGIHTRQAFTPSFLDDFSKNLIEPLMAMRDRGEVEIVNFTELIDIWQRVYAGKPALYNPLTNYIPDQFNVRIPSESGGTDGIFVRVTVPDSPRYSGGKAPVVVHAPGGWNGVGVTNNTRNLDSLGFVELDLNYPGSGVEGSASGGVYDHRGQNCIKAFKDVGRFAMGLIPDNNGYYLKDMLGTIVPDPANTGFCGWSNGGNSTITAAGAFGDELPGLAWIVNWESPVGDGMPNVDPGGPEKENPAYNPDTGVYDLTTLAYSTDQVNEDGNLGLIYFDINHNGTLNPAVDYVAAYQYYNGKAYYSDWLRKAVETLGVTFPEHIATVAQTTLFWRYRNAESWIPDAVEANPNLMFMVEAGDQDHVQRAKDHPHILIQYLGFLNAGVRFARVNPDRYYVEKLLGQTFPGAADNDGMKTYDHISIRTALQPRGLPVLSSQRSTVAGVCEMADRTYYNIIDPQIGETGIQLPDAGPGKKGSFVTCYPNPATDRVHFSFALSRGGKTIVDLYDIQGRHVRNLQGGDLAPGAHVITWDGEDASGTLMAPGIYYYRFNSAEAACTGQLMLLR